MKLELIEIEVGRIIDLRWQVLRAGMPRASALFEGDESARHFAAIDADDGDAVLACLSMMPQPFNGEDAWQLRGMACAEHCRGQGLGRQLMEKMQATLFAQQDAWLIWCNAREVAVGFYKKCGWQIESEAFDIPSAGLHFKMSKRGSA